MGRFKIFDEILEPLRNTLNKIKKVFKNVYDLIMDVLEVIWDIIVDFLKTLFDFIVELIHCILSLGWYLFWIFLPTLISVAIYFFGDGSNYEKGVVIIFFSASVLLIVAVDLKSKYLPIVIIVFGIIATPAYMVERWSHYQKPAKANIESSAYDLAPDKSKNKQDRYCDNQKKVLLNFANVK